MSACALDDGVGLPHLPAYSRRLDGLWGMYQWLPSSDRGRSSRLREADLGEDPCRSRHQHELAADVAALTDPVRLGGAVEREGLHLDHQLVLCQQSSH